MVKLLRFRDLKARGVVDSWAQLRRLIDHCEFPTGKLLSPNCRTWDEQEIDAWYAARPVKGQVLRGRAKTIRERARKAVPAAHNATA
jgi:hypothetical protein